MEEKKKMLQEFAEEQFGGDKKKNGIVILGMLSLGFVAAFLGLFIVLVPVTYVLGGQILYSEHGWKPFQPGVGGPRFVALNAFGWALYSIHLIMTAMNFFVGDFLLTAATFAVGMMGYGLVVSSLLTYQNDTATEEKNKVKIAAPSEAALQADTAAAAAAATTSSKQATFNESLETALLTNGEGPTNLWWFFVGFQTLMAMIGAWIAIASDLHAKYAVLKLLGGLIALWTLDVATAITHALGGQWRHLDAGFKAFMPGRGGARFVALQGAGWAIFATGQLLGLVALFGFARSRPVIPGPVLSLSGVLSLFGQIAVAASLFFFEAPPKVEGEAFKASPKSSVMELLKKTQFLGLNILFSGGSTYEKSREPNLSGPDDYKKGEERWARLTANAPCTGDQYLIIGVGFVGRRLVKRLLDRGEKKIRLFDIVPNNPFPGDERVEYVRGDVTKYEQVKAALEGVDTCYSTFAIIRFMDRLEHQAALSYRINVGGTENVLKACKECNVKRVVVTSSSHATTDEHSLPRLNRDESSPYVVRETAHNHYGWTKAAADIMCLQANGEPKADGTPLQIAIVRPCSGVFGGDDRISFEKAMDLTVFPGVGAKRIMDWVYVENVVLGHILLEAAMQRHDPGVDGEAFNISNNEAVKNEDMWFSVMKVIDKYTHPEKVKSSLELIFIPEAPLWALGYISELNQRIFKGKVSLGKDMDMLSPGMMATAIMEYSYMSDKAQRVLGYEPAYTLDEALQKSLYEYWELKFPDKKKN